MTIPTLVQLTQATRLHRRRIWQQMGVTAALPVSACGSVLLLLLLGASSIWMLPNRTWWVSVLVLVTIGAWLVTWWWRTPRNHAWWAVLDRVYGWHQSVRTAVQFADVHAQHPYAAPQYAQTLALIAATPPTVVPVWSRRTRWVLLGWGGALVLALTMPTPFDAQLAVQAQVQTLATALTTQFAALPPVNDSIDTAQVVAQIRDQNDAQQLVAQLDVTAQQLATAHQQAQLLAHYADALAHADTAASTDTIFASAASQLTPAQLTALQDAHQRATTGDSTAYTQLANQAQQQRRRADAWQQTVATAKQQAVQLAKPAAQTTAPTAAQSPAAGTTASSGTANQPARAAGGMPAPATGQQQGGTGTSMSQGTGSGTAAVQTATELQLFVPQLDARTAVTLQTPSGAASGETTLANGGGLESTSLRYTYTDVVSQASQRATQAIVDAQIPWTAQQTVRDYFTALQETTP